MSGDTIVMDGCRISTLEYRDGARVCTPNRDKRMWDLREPDPWCCYPRCTGRIVRRMGDAFLVRHANGTEALYSPRDLWVEGYPEPVFFDEVVCDAQ